MKCHYHKKRETKQINLSIGNKVKQPKQNEITPIQYIIYLHSKKKKGWGAIETAKSVKDYQKLFPLSKLRNTTNIGLPHVNQLDKFPGPVIDEKEKEVPTSLSVCRYPILKRRPPLRLFNYQVEIIYFYCRFY